MKNYFHDEKMLEAKIFDVTLCKKKKTLGFNRFILIVMYYPTM